MAGLELILSVFLACSGAALLYALIAQRRSGAFAPTALLVPVCFLVVQLIVTYRANARDSVLGHFYVELLLLAALCLASLYLAAFAYRCGAPRSFAPAAHLALTLAAACCVDMALARRLDGALPPASARRCCSSPIWRRRGISRGNNGIMPKTGKNGCSRSRFSY